MEHRTPTPGSPMTAPAGSSASSSVSIASTPSTPTAPAAVEASPSASFGAPDARIVRLEESVGRIIRGKSDVIRLALVSLIARGHILVEDVPGVGKTTLAQALTRSLGLAFQRIQFTSDLLPSDIIGVSIFNQKEQEFQFVPGPLFANVVLADEINRATPKTQSALLEAMSESRVSVERKRYALPKPFVVIATQNPLEYQGTFPLPESQLDRFMVSLRMGYPPPEDELGLLMEGGTKKSLETLDAVLTKDDVIALQEKAQEIRVVEKLGRYMLRLVEATRESEEFLLGVSTRGLQALHRATQAYALCEGRDYAVPDDVQRLAVPVLSHRIILKRGNGDLDAARDSIRRLVRSIDVPV